MIDHWCFDRCFNSLCDIIMIISVMFNDTTIQYNHHYYLLLSSFINLNNKVIHIWVDLNKLSALHFKNKC